MPPQRRGVPCRRLIRDSAGPAALALVNRIVARYLGMEAGAPKAIPPTLSQRLPREEERRSQFSDEEEAQYYEGEFKSGRTLVTVKAGQRYDDARSILQRDGAYDVHNERGTGATAGRTMASGMMDSTSQASATRVPVTEEELTTRKNREQAGEVVVSKDVVQEQRTVDVPVSRQDVTIERRPVDRDVAPGETTFTNTEKEIRVPVYEENVEVEKRPRVTEEVVVQPTQMTEQKHVTETVRREVPHVETRGEVGDAVHGDSTLTGRDIGRSYRPWSEVSSTYQSQWQGRYGTSGGNWQDVEPAYRFGYESYNDPRYQNRDWTTVEPELRRSWEASGNPSTWDRVKMHVSSFWNQARRAV
jgi:uncharacterized protein (TIGR02271 family)